MDWNRTKTIFIVTFLLLNLFLTWQLVETNNANQMNLITEATIQEKLKENNVNIEVELKEVEISSPLIVGKSVPFEQDNLILANQQIDIVEERTIYSVLEKPFPLTNDQFDIDLQQFLTGYVYKGGDYRYDNYDPQTKKVTLYQSYEGKMAYTLEEGPLTLQLDDELQIISYEQRYFEFEEQPGKEPELLSSLKAIEKLWTDQLIGMNQTITDVQFGYYNFFSPAGDVQVFAPMWRVTVGEEIYLVHAINSSVQKLSKS